MTKSNRVVYNMKIVAMGGGRFDDGEVKPLIEKIVSMARCEKPKMVYLPTAGFDDMSDVKPIYDMFESFGCTVSALLLTDETLTDAEIENTILGADIVFVGGGNLQFLMDTWKRRRVDVYLTKAAQNGTVLCGTSSGAMCWNKMGWDDCGEDRAYVFIECMGLLPYCFCPHYENGHWSNFGNYVSATGLDGVAADDGAALVYDNGAYSVVNGNDEGEVYYFSKEAGYARVKLSEDASELH